MPHLYAYIPLHIKIWFWIKFFFFKNLNGGWSCTIADKNQVSFQIYPKLDFLPCKIDHPQIKNSCRQNGPQGSGWMQKSDRLCSQDSSQAWQPWGEEVHLRKFINPFTRWWPREWSTAWIPLISNTKWHSMFHLTKMKGVTVLVSCGSTLPIAHQYHTKFYIFINLNLLLVYLI